MIVFIDEGIFVGYERVVGEEEVEELVVDEFELGFFMLFEDEGFLLVCESCVRF